MVELWHSVTGILRLPSENYNFDEVIFSWDTIYKSAVVQNPICVSHILKKDIRKLASITASIISVSFYFSCKSMMHMVLDILISKNCSSILESVKLREIQCFLLVLQLALNAAMQ